MFKLQHKEVPSRSLWLVGDKVTIGRNSSNDWVIDGLGVDDFHAEISIHSDYLILKSVEGSCLVNNLPVDKEYQLASGDELKIGNQRLIVLDPKTIEQAPSPKSSEVNVDEDSSNGQLEQSWTLIPDHPKLKNRDFSIVDRCVLGRAKECEFSIPYKMLSREHASLTIVDNLLILQDLGSSNGCYVNGKRVKKVNLKGGDKVSFAKLSFRVQPPSKAILKTVANTVNHVTKDDTNKTVIRPAVDIKAAIKKDQLSKGRKGSVSIEFQQVTVPKQDDDSTDKKPFISHWKWMLIAGVLVLIAVWFSTLIS
jgi:pSer/pThr/pTyr-binding forkhead associated (FHA) protein